MTEQPAQQEARRALAEAAEALAGLLRWELEEGRRALEVDPRAVAELGRAPPAGTGEGSSLEALAREIATCERCRLHASRTRTVPGEGRAGADIAFVGEGPGAVEDRSGRPFAGPAGGVLERLIRRMGYAREEVWIGNIVKCRATEGQAMVKDRKPDAEEMQACLPFLRRQLALVRPRMIVALGATALEGLTGLKGIGRHRGQWLEWEGLPLMPTYHPSYLLRPGSEQRKAFWQVWQDMTLVLEKLGKKPPSQPSAASE